MTTVVRIISLWFTPATPQQSDGSKPGSETINVAIYCGWKNKSSKIIKCFKWGKLFVAKSTSWMPGTKTLNLKNQMFHDMHRYTCRMAYWYTQASAQVSVSLPCVISNAGRITQKSCFWLYVPSVLTAGLYSIGTHATDTQGHITSYLHMFLVSSQWHMHTSTLISRIERCWGAPTGIETLRKKTNKTYPTKQQPVSQLVSETFFTNTKHRQKPCRAIYKRHWWLTTIKFCRDHHLPIKYMSLWPQWSL